MFVCMCVCVCACMHVFVHACMCVGCVCVHAYVYVCMHICCVCAHTSVCLCLCVSKSVTVCVSECVAGVIVKHSALSLNVNVEDWALYIFFFIGTYPPVPNTDLTMYPHVPTTCSHTYLTCV